MKPLCALLPLLIVGAASAQTHSGKEVIGTKEMKQAVAQPAPCPEWYANNEWEVTLWGAYAFTGEDWRNDRYLETDHAWGGGVDVKYFFARYFGIGAEGFLLDARRESFSGDEIVFPGDSSAKFISIPTTTTGHENRVIGALLATLTLRYPLPCLPSAPWIARIAPYVWGGGGAIFGGGERTTIVLDNSLAGFHFAESDSETKAMGQFGGGLEFRFSRHLGWMNDFSWNVIDGSRNNFGLVRSGITFAF